MATRQPTVAIILGVVGVLVLLAFGGAVLVCSDMRGRRLRELDELSRQNRELTGRITESRNIIADYARKADVAPMAAEVRIRNEQLLIANYEERRAGVLARMRDLQNDWP